MITYFKADIENLGDEALQKLRIGIEEAMKNNDNPMTVQHCFGRIMTGDWTLFLIVDVNGSEPELAGFFTTQIAPDQGNGAWINIPIAWSDRNTVIKDKSLGLRMDPIKESVKLLAERAKEDGFAGIQWVTKRNATRVPRSWGFELSDLKLWQMDLREG